MSRHCECCAGGISNDFQIANIKGYKKWKETLNEEEQELLHEEYDKKTGSLTVYFGIKWEKKENLWELDTAINHFHPYDSSCDWGEPAKFWAGLSMFTKEPIELYQTDEEYPFLTKVFGYDGKEDGGYRVFAEKGNIIIQQLTFKVIGTEKYKKEDLFEKEDLDYIKEIEEKLCDRCDNKIDYKFRFENRGYFEEISKSSNYKKICEKCYKQLKEPFVKKRKLESEIQNKQDELRKLQEVSGNSSHK